ncbi:thioredoxin domain-containing protein [Nonomuraea sp. NPDC005650]|uniref:DsbA family protein n=1 Tax=Nonomuraea sp. NPDC005650 TaxID=3157045 RepID=UPI0033BF01D3
MTTNLKVTLGIGAITALILALIVTAVVLLGPERADPPATASGSRTTPAEFLVREDSHRLSTAADGKVTLVEFLDFECEACGAAFPHMERIRAEYAGRINLVVRYFPMPGHRNGDLAARAAEAAAGQGKFAAMYAKLFQTQAQWGEATESKQAFFLDLAEQAGLDLAAFKRDLDAAKTAERVEKDQGDGMALGVQGTPTVFFNGTLLDVEPSYDNLKAKIDAALRS